jgi:hypothetical protein
VLRRVWTEVEFQSKDVFLSPEKSRAALGLTKPPSQRAPPFFLGTKRPERDADHSASHSVKVESEGSCASISPVPSRHVRDNFIFHFNITDKICDLCFSLTLPFYKVESFMSYEIHRDFSKTTN